MELKKLVFGDKVLTVFYFEFASIDFRVFGSFYFGSGSILELC